jgi:diaminopimelate epimerase
MKNKPVKIILAAGGNPTGIMLVDDAANRNEYASIAKEFMVKHPEVEQFGFLEGVSHFQMSGGEFCGNAARAAALLLSEKNSSKSGSFTMSGFDGVVNYQILESGEVECVFTNLKISSENLTSAKIIDLGGIVHIVLPNSEVFRNDKAYYTKIHRDWVNKLNLNNRSAVGVIWQETLDDNSVIIHPVVWVRDIDSFFYETACGSGTLAVLEASKETSKKVIQPSGQSIQSEKLSETSYLLSSEMNILDNQ